MTVQQLIDELLKMPKDAVVIIFDGPSYCTPSRVFVADGFSKNLNGKIIID